MSYTTRYITILEKDSDYKTRSFLRNSGSIVTAINRQTLSTQSSFLIPSPDNFPSVNIEVSEVSSRFWASPSNFLETHLPPGNATEMNFS